MPFMTINYLNENVVPILKKGLDDKIPNVKICVARILKNRMNFIDPNVFAQLIPVLKEKLND